MLLCLSDVSDSGTPSLAQENSCAYMVAEHFQPLQTIMVSLEQMQQLLHQNAKCFEGLANPTRSSVGKARPAERSRWVVRMHRRQDYPGLRHLSTAREITKWREWSMKLLAVVKEVAFQVTDVRKPLAAVSRVLDKGNQGIVQQARFQLTE